MNQADAAFLRGMIEHHRDAITMASGVLQRGEDPQVRALAQGIITAQTAEIDRMEGLLEDAPTGSLRDAVGRQMRM